MKKGILSIVLLAYLALSSGVMVSFHYCMDKLDSTELFSSGSKECARCGMHLDDDNPNGCCRDELRMVKIGDDQRMASFIEFLIQAPDALPTSVQPLVVTAALSEPGLVRAVPEDPMPPGQALYIQHRVFRI